MHVLLISTYDLGRQPFGLASPAAWLRREGAEVACLDLAVEPLDERVVSRADLVAFHLPMHTATRIAARVVERVKALNRGAHLCCYGLYAPMNEAFLRTLGVQTVLGGEYEEGLVSLMRRLGTSPLALVASAPVASLPASDANRSTPGASRPHGEVAGHQVAHAVDSRASQVEPLVSLSRQDFLTPYRIGLPPLSEYARLHDEKGRLRTVGYTEASRGCKHLCRHCPIVPVYGGRFRIVQRDVVLEDIRQQVAAGAEHITFGDPDFFNGIGHALALVRSLHQDHPSLTYDATIKIEHLIRYGRHLPTLKETGCLFITSAVESIDDRVLELLDKGHTRRDVTTVLRDLRVAGLILVPTFVPFTPWTSIEGYVELLEFLADLDLVDHVAPVQLAIRLLIPAGSKLLDVREVGEIVGPFDPKALVHPWRHEDPRVDGLQVRVESLVRSAAARGESRCEIFSSVLSLADIEKSGRKFLAARASIPYLTEPWYC